MKNIKHKTIIFIITSCLLVAGCQYNEAVVNNPSATETAIWETVWDSVFATQTQISKISSESTNEVSTLTPAPMLTVTPFGNDEIAALQCKPYIETTWGDETEQWGYSDDTASRFSLLPVVFKSEDEIYFSDFANLRLLKHNGTNKMLQQIINLEPFFPKDYTYSWQTMFVRPPASLISISKDKIYIPYGGNQIGILSLDGEIINNITIPEHYYDYNFPTIDHAWVDKEGDLHVFGGASFKTGWENLDWVETNEPTLRYYSWNEFLVAQDGVSLSGFDIIVYEKDKSGSFSKRYSFRPNITTKTGVIFFPMFGVDNNGYLYLKELSEDPSERLFARYLIPTGEKQIASLPYPYDGQYTTLEPSVSPDGFIYFVAYNNGDLSVAPAIIKCNFPP